ncbi:MAG: asparagine synthase-related protein [Paludibacteraceae bacterium]
MPGFIGAIGKTIPVFNSEERSKLVQEILAGDSYRVERRTVNKFMNDKVFVDSTDLLIVIEGVVLNKKDLIDQYVPGDSFESCIRRMYAVSGETFFNQFRGSFSGVLFDKVNEKWLIFTDQIGDKQIFYSELTDGLLFGSEMRFMVETLNANNLPVTLNNTGAYLVLTHGFVIEDHTLVNEVKKLSAGHYLKLDKSGLHEIQYHRFSNQPRKEMTEQEAVEGIDRLFRQAVKRQFDKDLEYGYKHITCLSGGLDSRMTVWVAHQMGYTEQLNTTFSQSNYLDFTIAQQIATDLHHDFLFKALDHGIFIRDIDQVTALTYGNANFFGLAHGKSLYDIINFEPYGIVHTGMIGDAIIGTFFKKNEYNPEVKIGQGAYSLELIDRLADYKFKYEYENEEIFCLYTRAFTGANQGMVVFQEHTEAVSPFCDVDFMEFCYSIPLNLRFNHKIYFDWILSKYSGAAEYIWEKKRAKIHTISNKEPVYMTLMGKKVPAWNDEHFSTWFKGALMRKLGLRKRGEKTKTITITGKDNMNPVDYWYNENRDFRQFIDEYGQKLLPMIRDKELSADLKLLFDSKSVVDKLQVMSFISVLERIEN